MRPRSRSIGVPSASYIEKDSEDDESINSEEEDTKIKNVKNDKSKTKGDWTPEEQLTLLCQVKKLIPRKDKLPFNQRLENIEWFHMQVGNRTLNEIKTEFNNILSSTRTFRLLEEIVKDMHSEILPKLGIEKPKPAFVIFCHEHREEIEKAIQKNSKKGSFSHIGALMFNECSEDIRESYKQKAKEYREEYDRMMSLYELPKGRRAIQGKTIKYTPMQCFVQAQILKDPESSKMHLRKEYSNLSRKQKLKWILRWIGIKHGEKANLDQYFKTREILTKTEQDIFDEYEGRPRFINAYNMYMRDNLGKKNANDSHRENFKSFVADWKTLPETMKKEYNDKAKKLKKNFTADFSRFVASLPTDRHDYEIKLLSLKDAGPKGRSKRRSKTEGKSDVEEGTEHDDEDFEPMQEKAKYNEDDDDENQDDQDEERYNEHGEGYDQEEEDVHNTITVNDTKKDAPQSTVTDNDDNVDDDDDDDDDGGSFSYQDDDRNEKIFECDTSALQRSLEQGQQAEQNLSKRNLQQMPKDVKSAPMTILHSTPNVKDTDDKTTKTNHKKTDKKQKQVLIDTMLKTKANQKAKESDDEEIPPYQSKAEINTSIKEEPASDTGSKSPAKPKKRKTSIGETNPTETKKVKESSASSDLGVDLDKVKDERTIALEKKYRKMLARKPPETLVQWYAKLNFEGSTKKAKKALNAVSLEERQSIEAEFETAKTKYAKKFKAFADTLDAEELSHFSTLFEAN